MPWLTWFCKIFWISPSPRWGKHTTRIPPFLLFIHDSYFCPLICFSCNHSQFHNGNSIFLRAHAPNKNSAFSLIPVSNPSANPVESSFKISPVSDHFLAPQSIFSQSHRSFFLSSNLVPLLLPLLPGLFSHRTQRDFVKSKVRSCLSLLINTPNGILSPHVVLDSAIGPPRCSWNKPDTFLPQGLWAC